MVAELLEIGSGIITEQHLSAARATARSVLLAEQSNSPPADSFLELTLLAHGAYGLDVRVTFALFLSQR